MGRIATAAALEQAVFHESSLIAGLPVSGARQNAGFNPVSTRVIGEQWVDAYNRLYSSMDARQKAAADCVVPDGRRC